MTTVYHHKLSRDLLTDHNEFSFLVETLPSRPTEGDETLQEQMQRLEDVANDLLQNMNSLDERVKQELARRGRMEYMRLNERPFTLTNDSVEYKRSLGNNTEFSEVEKEASVFEVDENNNFFKYREKSLTKQRQNLTRSQIVCKEPKPQSRNQGRRKRVYESVLSRFTTATLLKMNGDEQP